VRVWAAHTSAKLTLMLTGPSLLRAQAPSLAHQHEHHLKAAKVFRKSEAGLKRFCYWPRMGWGCFHLAVKALLHVIDWVFASFWRLVIAAGVYTALKFWLWRGLP
jgi:hypothetical protein